MSKWPGKKFEKDFVRQAEEDKHYLVYRCRDVQGYAGSVNISDYIIYNGSYLVLAELKSTKGKSVPFSRLNDKQMDMMLNVTANWTVPIYVFNFRGNINETYFATTEQVAEYIENADRKSIPIDWLRENWEQVQQKLRQTRYDYYMDGVFLDIILMKNAEG